MTDRELLDLAAKAAGQDFVNLLSHGKWNPLTDAVERPSHCPVFGVELVYQATGRRTANSASLDRIDSALGYTRGNVWVISWRANMLKSNATIAELRQLLAALEKKAAGRLLDGVTHDGFPG